MDVICPDGPLAKEKSARFSSIWYVLIVDGFQCGDNYFVVQIIDPNKNIYHWLSAQSMHGRTAYVLQRSDRNPSEPS